MIGAVMFLLLLVLMFIGVPIAFAMGGSALLMLLINNTASPVTIAQKAVNGLDSFTIMAIPFFMSAAFIMSGTDVGAKIFKFSSTLVRHIRGGMAHVNILCSMIMAGMSGSAVSDVSGIGRMEIQAMEDEGYDRDFGAAVTAASSTIAPIIPPSTSAVLYGSITGVSIGKLLIGGLLPGILMGVLMMVICYYTSKKRNYPLVERATRRERWKSFKDSFAALMMPVILIGGILSGYFTPTEGAYASLIASLSPRPTGGIEAGPVVYVQPDVTLSLEARRWRVTLHEGGFDIRVSADCAALLRDAHDQETREYLRERIGQARFLQCCVRRRGETLLRLAQCLAQTQSDYLCARGELAPLTMEDLACMTGLHLSTVSRALKDKTVRTPRGCMPMKGLLCGRPSRQAGAAQGVSSAQVKAALGRLLSQEAPGAPLSDEALALRLGEQGVPLARRTVAKYRKALGIPGAYERAAMRQ